jgi:hypothetical protein
MEQELQESDIVVQDRNGLGMSVRYKLPRAIQRSAHALTALAAKQAGSGINPERRHS